MSTQTSPQISDVARRGLAIIDALPADVVAAHRLQVIAVDVKTGQYVIDRTMRAAFDKLKAIVPDAEVFYNRVGDTVMDRIGSTRKRPS